MKLLIDTYKKRKDKVLEDYLFTKCPHCKNELLIGKEGLFESIKSVPWWIWILILAVFAYIDFESFKWLFVDTAYKASLIALGIWLIGLLIAFIISMISGLFS
ncbi:MAG: hypothetical protein JW743_06485 [Deltaproteobacteria bacterium]|nr:hypothetical protein [Deltaproteobacteria bacterium]MBN2846105.1 hypothetical protein [Deltaproteobacteria bacterium]HES59359.1 hypothetical protein [Caldithrix sp.]